ncbi:C40 family peptidase [Tropicimonas sp. IMCC34043]|uniref:C40 family peptidase n=1 Tax=Tropicimonas sp. IMCC34043 TaxID=2248760 RepID=UPI000E26BD6B|nr:C40 family peptidase [Tropicimonas sp. IMCC34043]
MSDRRTTPANDRVAALELRGHLADRRFVAGDWHRLAVPVADLLDAPDGARDRQLVFGQRLRVFEVRDGFSFLQAERDGYVGYLDATSLGADRDASHRVIAPATHRYPAPDIKRREIGWLSFGSEVSVLGIEGAFAELAEGGFVPARHIAPLGDPLSDPVAVARLFLGTPYLWGGNSRAGIDCSGLVQAALVACGLPCPGDSDQQCETLGTALAAGSAPQAGDLFFWRGHVAMASGPGTMIHANAHHMAVAEEPIAPAMARIAATDTGPLMAHRRIAGLAGNSG